MLTKRDLLQGSVAVAALSAAAGHPDRAAAQPHEQFMTHMNGMRGRGDRIVPKVDRTRAESDRAARDLTRTRAAYPADRPPPGVDSVVADLKAGLGRIQQQQLALIADAKAAQAAGDDEGFKRKMDEAKEKAKREADAEIDRAYARLEQIGVAHPQAQSVIMAATAALEHEIGGLVDTLHSALDTVTGGLSKGVNEVEKVAEKAGEDIKKGVETVGHAIESIFHGW
jgi:hypothetical protein